MQPVQCDSHPRVAEYCDVMHCDAEYCDVMYCFLCDVLLLHYTSSVTRMIASQLPLTNMYKNI